MLVVSSLELSGARKLEKRAFERESEGREKKNESLSLEASKLRFS